MLGVCLGHQAIGAVFGGRVVRAPVPMHGKTSTIEHDGRGVFAGLASPFDASRYHSLVVAERGPAGRARSVRAHRGRRHRSWACGTGRWPVHGVQFHPESILTAKAAACCATFWTASRTGRHVSDADRETDAARGPDDRRGRRGDGRVMTGQATPAQIAALAGRPGDEGRAARRRSSAWRGRCARMPCSCRRAYGEVVRHLRHRRRSVGHVQHLVGARAGRRRVRRARREARQPVGVEPVRQRRRLRGARRRVTAPPAVVERCLERGRHRVLLRADVPSVDAARRARRGASSACGPRSTCSGR